MSGDLEMVHELGESSDSTQIGVTLARENEHYLQRGPYTVINSMMEVLQKTLEWNLQVNSHSSWKMMSLE